MIDPFGLKRLFFFAGSVAAPGAARQARQRQRISGDTEAAHGEDQREKAGEEKNFHQDHRERSGEGSTT